MASGFDSAREAGYKAAKEGLSKEACPYKFKKGTYHKYSWTKGWRDVWFAGYQQGLSEKTK